MLTAPRFAAWEHGALRLGRAVNLQRLADRRALAVGLTSELDAFWLVVHRRLGRARRRLPCSSWLEAHAHHSFRPWTVEEPPGDPLVPPDDID